MHYKASFKEFLPSIPHLCPVCASSFSLLCTSLLHSSHCSYPFSFFFVSYLSSSPLSISLPRPLFINNPICLFLYPSSSTFLVALFSSSPTMRPDICSLLSSLLIVFSSHHPISLLLSVSFSVLSPHDPLLFHFALVYLFLSLTMCAPVHLLTLFSLPSPHPTPPPPSMLGLVRVPVAVSSLGLLRLLGAPWSWSLAAGLGVYLGTGGWRFLYVVIRTAKRDLL